jgi:hypothetical protein
VVLGAAEAEELGALISCRVFAASHDLSDAVSAFNLWAVQLADEQLHAPPPSFLRAHGLLRQNLGIQDARGATMTLGNGSSNGHASHGNDHQRSHLLPTPAQMWKEAYGWVFPGMSVATPTGFGAGFGNRMGLDLHLHRTLAGVGVFGSVGVRVAPPISLVAEWTGQDLMLATSLTPLRNQRLGITAGLTELTGAAGDGPRFAVGASVGFEMKGR